MATRTRSVILNCTDIATRGIFLLFCARLMAATFYYSWPTAGPLIVLLGGSIVIGYWKPLGAFVALVASVFLLNGIHLVLPYPVPLSLVSASIYVGSELRFARNWIDRPSTPSVCPPSKTTEIVIILTAGFTFSLCSQLWSLRHSEALQAALWREPDFLFGSSHYFLTSGFLWLQGLFLFQRLEPHRATVVRMLKPTLCVWYFSICATFLFQYIFEIPYPYQTYAYYFPCEDIHAFGTVVVTAMLFALALLSVPQSWVSRTALLIALLSLAVMVVASWSRATWLAAIVFSYILIVIRLPTRWKIGTSAALAFGILVINLNVHSEFGTRHPYMVRLNSLFRVENPITKSSGRYELAKKAFAMIMERPFAGHGVGTFYRKSPHYAQPNDPRGNLPEFAHNAVLQLAAEMGLPLTFLLLSPILIVLGKASTVWIKRVPGGTHRVAAETTLAFALSIALGTYLWTQLTANAINIYLSSQIFFGFLFIALLEVATPIKPHLENSIK